MADDERRPILLGEAPSRAAVIGDVTMYECSTCRKRKPRSAFSNRKDRPSGRTSACKQCRSDNARGRVSERRLAARKALGTHQRCWKCNETKPLSDFTPHATSRTGLSKKCRSCISRDAKKMYPVTLDPLYPRASALRAYGLTLAEYDDLLRGQDGRCAICRKPESRIVRGRRANLCVDHNHETGQIRGLLCSRCNVALGLLGDDVDVLAAALEYLALRAADAERLAV